MVTPPVPSVESLALDGYIDALGTGLESPVTGISEGLSTLVDCLAALPVSAWDVARDQVPLVDAYIDSLGIGAPPVGLDPVIARIIERVASLPAATWELLPTAAELVALDAYIDALGTGAEAPVGVSAGILTLVDRLAAMPAKIWAALPSRHELLALDAFIDSYAFEQSHTASIDPSVVELVRNLVALPPVIWEALPNRADVLALDAYIDAYGLVPSEVAASLPSGLTQLVDRLTQVPAGYWEKAPSTLELTALDVLIDSLSMADVPASRNIDRSLTRLVAALAALPVSAWEDDWTPSRTEEPEELPAAAAAPAGLRLIVGTAPAPAAKRRSAPPRRRLEAIVGIAAAAVVLAVTASVSGFGSHPPQSPTPSAKAAAWSLSSFIDQPAWQNSGNASALGSAAVAVSCGGSTSCVADARSTSVDEYTTNGGDTWQASSLPGRAIFVSPVDCVTASDCFASGLSGTPTASDTGVSGLFFSTRDGGANWSDTTLPGGQFHMTDLSCTSDTSCVGVGFTSPSSSSADTEDSFVSEVTNDGGATWAATALPSAFIPSGLASLACDQSGACTLVGQNGTAQNGTAQNGAALTSTDDGSTWQAAAVPAGVGQLLQVSCGDATHCLATAQASSESGDAAATPSVILSSTDGGSTWLPTLATGLPAASLSSLSCSSATTCVATGASLAQPAGENGAGVLAQTTDGGLSWSPIVLPTQASSTGEDARTKRVSSTTDWGASTTTVNVDLVSSVSCAASGSCVALASQQQTAQFSPAEVVFTSQPAT